MAKVKATAIAKPQETEKRHCPSGGGALLLERIPMIKINQRATGISISGHAHYAEPGKDIVCAAVSSLAQTLIYSIEELTADKIKYVSKPGTVEIEHGDLSKDAQLLISAFFVGVQMIANEYPDNVRVHQKVTKH